MDTARSIVVHGQVKGVCAECGAPLKWAERTINRDRSKVSQVLLVCRNNHRLIDALAISSLAATIMGG